MSRLTFRETVDSCWQKQLRDKYLEEGTPPVPHLSVKRARVRPVSRKLAEQIILKYEWLGTMAQTRQHFGIFFGPFCAGVTCVGISATGGMNSAKEFKVAYDELAILARGACVHWAPVGTNSRLVSWTARLLPSVEPQAKVMIAYADTDAGEIGTIYQACNWTYLGLGSSVLQLIAPNGRIYDQSMIYQWRKRDGLLKTVSWSAYRDRLLASGWSTQSTNPKHRYVQILDKSDKALIQRVERMAQPYPKRAGVA